MSGHRDEQEKALSGREWDILNLLAQGQGNQEIAVQLAVSVKTVEAHITAIYTKLGVGSRSQAIMWLKSVRH